MAVSIDFNIAGEKIDIPTMIMIQVGGEMMDSNQILV
jgi:hypothetical protein